MEKKNYTVTDKAGPRVAGRAVDVEQTLELTEAEARYELQTGTIKLASAEPATKPVVPENPAPVSKKK